jgi:aryl-alcohol dehydrogenase-like predicted oxidoreductase
VDGPRFWHPRGFKTAEILEDVSASSDIPMAKLAVAWPLKRRFVASVVIGVKTNDQLTENLELGDWDMPDDIWQTLEEKTRPEEDYLTFFNKLNYNRHFAAAEFHNADDELP